MRDGSQSGRESFDQSTERNLAHFAGSKSFPLHRYNNQCPARDRVPAVAGRYLRGLGRNLIRNVWCSFRLRFLLALLTSVDADA